MTSKVWTVMNDLEMVTSKVCSAREIIDSAAEAIGNNDYSRAETLMTAAYEFLGYYLEEFDEKFKLAWKETVTKEKEEDPCMTPWGHSDLEYLVNNSKKDKVIKWVLPTEVDGLTGDVFVTFPEDLLEAANLKEGDEVEWIDNGDNSFTLKKV